MNACMGSKGKAPLILNLGTRWRWTVNFMPRRLNSGKEPKYLFQRSLGGAKNQYGGFGKDKYLLSTPGFKPRIVQTWAQTQ